MKGERSRIFRSGNWTRGDKDGERKDEGYIRLANTKVRQGHIKVLRVGKLLLSIHSELCIYSKTIVQYDKKRSEVGIDGETRKSVWRVKRKFYTETSVSNAGFR